MSGGWSPPPYPQQPYQPQQPAPRRGGLPVWAQLLIGAVVGPMVLGAASLPAGILSSLVAGTGAEGVQAVIALLGLGLPLAVLVAGLVWAPTRWYAVGTIIGIALLFIVLAGACIAILAGLSSSS